MTKARALGLTAAAAGLLLTLLINYHSFLTNFNLVPGDEGDTRLVVFTLEHWYGTLRGQEAPLQLNMFYPDKLALGYADALMLFALPYVVLRGLGMDYFTSYQLVLVILTACGYGMYLRLMRRVLKLDLSFAVVGAVILTSLNSMQLQIDIGKLLGFYFWPGLVLLLFGYARGVQAGRPRNWLSLAGFSGLLGLLFFTSYYPAWYFVFTLAVFAAVWLVGASLQMGPRTAAGHVAAFIRAQGSDLAIGLAVLVISLVPFGLTYAPLISLNATRSYALVQDFTPTVRDIVNVSAHNYMWSPLLTALHFNFGNREVQLGTPMLVLAIFAVFYGLQVRDALRGRLTEVGDRLVFGLGTTAIIIWALTVQIRGLSLWYVVYQLVPGASVLRAEGRYLMVADMLIAAIAAFGLNKLHRNLMGRTPRSHTLGLSVGIALASALLIAEQINATPFRLDKARQLAFMDSFPKPAGECQAFFLSNPPGLDLPIGYYQLDAMMIAMKLGIPTVNGYSGIGPDPVFAIVPTGVDYEYGIMRWLRANGVEQGICELNDQSRTFTGVSINAAYDRYLQAVRDQALHTYTTLFEAVGGFVDQKNDLANLDPQFLEEHGYLDSSFGFQTGPAYRWIHDKYWIGTRACGKVQCPAIGIVASYIEIEDIIEGYGPKSVQVYFPAPRPFDPHTAVAPDTQGELLIVFPTTAFGG